MNLVKQLDRRLDTEGEEPDEVVMDGGNQYEPLRDYQVEILQAVSAGNKLVVMPANTGKTRVFVEHAR